MLKLRILVPLAVLMAVRLAHAGDTCPTAGNGASTQEGPVRADAPGGLCLWYDRPAEKWMTEALPIGNGPMGAMLFGGTMVERIQFNEISLWSGVRMAVEGLGDDDQDLGAYQAFGDILIHLGHDFSKATNYRRELDIDRAVHRVTYEYHGVRYQRTAFASHPDRVIVIHLTADKPAALTGRVQLADMHQARIAAQGNRLTAVGKLGNGFEYEGQVLVLTTSGALTVKDDDACAKNPWNLAVPAASLAFDRCDSVTLILGAGTDFLQDHTAQWLGPHPHAAVTKRVDAAAGDTVANLEMRHVRDYQALFRRFSLDVGATAPEARAKTTLARLEDYSRNRATDPELEALFCQFGRYLLISCSRPGSLPANLQGVWNDSNEPAWAGDYHSNINIEMNYWPAEPTNLAECHRPFIHYVMSIREVSAKNTRRKYGQVPGWTVQTMNNACGVGYFLWNPPGSAWYAQHLWEHFAFGRDKDYLRATAYPVLKEACQFWDDRLKKRPDGTLVTPDGWSPEQYKYKAEEGVTYDQELIYDLFTNTIEAADVLGDDREFRDHIAGLRDKLLKPKVGRWGQLQEWEEDKDDPKDDHRHVSHLFALYPGRQITRATTPELAEAARVSLKARGDQSTGWSRAWKINFWARLWDGDHAYTMLRSLLKVVRETDVVYGERGGGVYPNLFDSHPPFQIDGNFGATAGYCEMLVQSHAGRIHLLPALPRAWPTGKVSGLCARGGFEVEMRWEGGHLTGAVIHSKAGLPCKVVCGDQSWEFDTTAGKSYPLALARPAHAASPAAEASARVLAQVEPRIKAIYEAGEFRMRSFHATWLPDGSGYLRLETPDGAAEAEIVRYDCAGGQRTVVVGGEKLLVPATKHRLRIRGFVRAPSGNRFLLHAESAGGEDGSDHWLYEPESEALQPVKAGRGAWFDANAFSPDGRRLLGSRGADLIVYDIAGGRTISLTRDGVPDAIDNGQASWSPDGQWIAYIQTDSSAVPKRAALVPGDPTFRTFRETRIERIGGPISTLRVGVVGVEGGPTRWIGLADKPGTFYLNPLGWAGNSDAVLIDKFSRSRDAREVLLANHHTGAIAKAYAETDPAWVDMENGGLAWIGGGKTFVVFSERDGWRRAYVVSRDGAGMTAITPAGSDIIERGQLDGKNGWLYYFASPSNATERYLYRARLDGTGTPERVTPGDQPGSHEYVLSPDSRWAFHTYSTFDTPPVTDLVQLPEHRSVRVLVDNAAAAARVKPLIARPTEFLKLDIGGGVAMDAWLIKPREFDPAKKYPVFVFVYGEPAGQTVLDDWYGGQAHTLFHRAVADLGYVVVSIDNRGTPAPKGAAWRRAVFGSLGPLSTEEQAAGLKALAQVRPFVDLSRVAIWGWSGGGSNTLNALFRKPDIYHVGIAVVPKPQPQYYWAGYQEIYMRTPEDNPEGYRTCAPITYAEGLRGDLLIIVGTGETNTHVEITEGLVDRLIALGKRFDYFAYPNRDHGLHEGEGTEVHVRMLIIRYLIEHVPPGAR